MIGRLLARLRTLPQARQAEAAWSRMEVRDRLALGGLALFFAALALYFGVWKAGYDFLETARARHEQSRALLAYMQSTRQQAQAVAANVAQTTASSDDPVLSVVTRTTRAASLAPSRMQPEGDDAVNVWFEDVTFDTLIDWVEQLHRQQGLRVRQIAVDLQDQPGLVSARVVVAQ